MKLETLNLGVLEVADQDVVHFDRGILGLPHLSRFVICESEDYQPFKFLQSLDSREILFLLMDPRLVDSGYQIRLNEEIRRDLELGEDHQLAVYAIVTLSSAAEETTANLLAPLLINATRMRGCQTIQEGTVYQIRHRVLDAGTSGN